MPTKLPHYALPLYPALALLAAQALVDGVGSSRRVRWIIAANTLLWLLVTLVIAAALIALPLRLGGGVRVAAVAGAIAIVVLAAVLVWRRPGPRGAAALLAMLAVGLVVPASLVVPRLDRLWLSRAAAALVARHPPPPGAPLAVIGYTEPSLVFLLGGDLKQQTADVPVAAGGKALVSGRDTALFEQTLASHGLAARPVDSVRGTDYSNGEPMTLTLYQIGPP